MGAWRSFYFKPVASGGGYRVEVWVKSSHKRRTLLGTLQMSRREWEGLREVLWWAHTRWDSRDVLNDVCVDQKGWQHTLFPKVR